MFPQGLSPRLLIYPLWFLNPDELTPTIIRVLQSPDINVELVQNVTRPLKILSLMQKTVEKMNDYYSKTHIIPEIVFLYIPASANIDEIHDRNIKSLLMTAAKKRWRSLYEVSPWLGYTEISLSHMMKRRFQGTGVKHKIFPFMMNNGEFDIVIAHTSNDPIIREIYREIILCLKNLKYPNFDPQNHLNQAITLKAGFKKVFQVELKLGMMRQTQSIESYVEISSPNSRMTIREVLYPYIPRNHPVRVLGESSVRANLLSDYLLVWAEQKGLLPEKEGFPPPDFYRLMVGEFLKSLGDREETGLEKLRTQMFSYYCEKESMQKICQKIHNKIEIIPLNAKNITNNPFIMHSKETLEAQYACLLDHFSKEC